MGFSTAQYDAVVDEINRNLDDLTAKMNDVPGVVNRALDQWWVTGAIADAVKWCGEKLLELGSWIWNKIVELLKGVAAPVYMYTFSQDWEGIRGDATAIQGQLARGVLGANRYWTGTAASAYDAATLPQGAAAGKIGTLADKISTALAISAGASLAFYVGLAAILVKFISAAVAAIAALGSAVFSWAGLLLIVEEAGVNSAAIWALVAALTAALGTQVSQMLAIQGETVDNSTFPGGCWPDPIASTFSDGTRLDGDADWSVK